MEEDLIIEIWDTFKDYVPEKSRETAANQFVDFLVNRDVEASTLQSLLGYDQYLDTAIEMVLDEHNEANEEDEYEEDSYDYREDDEDY